MTILELITENYARLLEGMGRTLLLTFWSLILATVLGLIFGMMKVARGKVWHILSSVYVDVIRGIPVLVLAFFVYFGIPQGFGVNISIFQASLIVLSLNAGAYMAEIVRGGIQSVDQGQMEAARSLGLPYGRAMRKVVLPQAIRTMIPSIINQFIITLKDTSILSVIGYADLIKVAKAIIARNFEAFRMWLIVALMYLIVITVLSKIAKAIERRMTYAK
ncbi:amino acid ABC transporter permease [Diplocloster modestus]|uniref:Amino acid ABC transporter permease n=1 Tax=Diplocloster modestus TaxID=2850322 RepID=A0ABS6K1Z4_9FIRM|nr:amino acid ABC transporter permease [Diplocloster modestus]MBU9724765.1 amino acid ABC transporter permease [Diplocloster modestus]